MSPNWVKLYQVFDTGPLEANQVQDLWVDLTEVRGENEPGSVVEFLESSIRMASGHTCQLVSGHQGSGKSTELRRLKRKLEEGSERNFAVVCDIEGELALDDTDFPDLLLAMVRQTAKALREDLKIELKPGYFASRAKELKDLLSRDVTLKEASLESVLGAMVMSLKASPESRARIRQALEPKVESLLSNANDVFDQARIALKKKGFKDLVLIVDGSDKLKLGLKSGTGNYPGERLFVRRVDQTRGFAAHVVYAIPMALAYSVLNNDLESLYGQHVPILPITKVHDRRAKPVTKAYQKFRELIDKRLTHVNESFNAVFRNQDVRDEIIRLSAGEPRKLCNLIRDCLRTRHAIDKTTIEAVARREAMAFGSWLEAPHWQLIRKYRSGKQPPRDMANREIFRDLISGGVLLHYRNKEQWLAVSPLVGPLPDGL